MQMRGLYESTRKEGVDIVVARKLKKPFVVSLTIDTVLCIASSLIVLSEDNCTLKLFV